MTHTRPRKGIRAGLFLPFVHEKSSPLQIAIQSEMFSFGICVAESRRSGEERACSLEPRQKLILKKRKHSERNERSSGPDLLSCCSFQLTCDVSDFIQRDSAIITTGCIF